MSEFKGLENSTSKRVLNQLESIVVGTLEGYNTENYSSHVWSAQWELRQDWLFWKQRKDGCSEVRECEYSRI